MFNKGWVVIGYEFCKYSYCGGWVVSTVSCRIYLFFYEFTSSTTLIYIQYRNFYDTTYLHSCRILYTISSLPFYIFLLSLSTSSSQIHNYTSHRRTNTPEWSLSASRRPQVMAFSPSFTPRWAGSVIASRVPQPSLAPHIGPID